MGFLFKLIRPLLFLLKPECAHNVTLKMLELNLIPAPKKDFGTTLQQTIWGLTFDNPVGLSAGFDKNAEAIAPVLKMGFGFTEVGTVTPQPQQGNPKPRIFRDVKNEAVINRMGFPNGGMDIFDAHYRDFLSHPHKPSGIVGINIGMNKTQTEPSKDYAALIKKFAKDANYLTINISSPNTPGLRDLQERGPLLELLNAVKAQRQETCKDHQPPILVKFAPDLDDDKIAELCATVLEAGIDGVIVGNTTLDRPEYLNETFLLEKGGLSGKPLTQKSTAKIRVFYKHLNGKIPIIGVGGISSAQDAYEKIKAGASLVQLYTALIYQGPSLPVDINTGLMELLRKDGYSHISEAVGIDHQ